MPRLRRNIVVTNSVYFRLGFVGIVTSPGGGRGYKKNLTKKINTYDFYDTYYQKKINYVDLHILFTNLQI